MKPKLFEKIRWFSGEMKAKKVIASFALVLLAIHLTQAQGMKPNKTVSTTGQVSNAVAGKKTTGALAQAPTRPQILKTYGKLPRSFEANQGQTDPQVKFLSRGSGYSLFLTNNQAVLLLKRPDVSKTRQQPHTVSATAEPTRAHAIAASVLRIKLVAANPATKTVGLDELAGKSNYFIGNDPQKWRTNVANYARVQYREIYPGVDLVYYGNQGQLEHDFVVAPGANPKIIRMRFEGDRGHKLAANGDLVLSIKGGEVRLQKPRIYQEIGGVQREVAGRYVPKGKRQVGFAVAAYDTTRPLVIDPVLFYSTYLGGSDYDQSNGIAVDASGDAYVTGYTSSSNFPTTTGAFQTAFGGASDAFVTELNPTGSALVYSTYLGGSGYDQGNGIAVDASGNAYVTGSTSSTNFPSSSGASQTASGGGTDAFVTKLDPTGSALGYSTYLGGVDEDQGTGIAVDALDNAYVTGFTFSSTFPTTPGAFDTIFGGTPFLEDAFVTKLNPLGSGLVYSTYLGGSDVDQGRGIAVEASGNAYVTGYTYSSNFPTTTGAFQTTFGGGSFDAFVTKLNPAGSAPLLYSTYLGGFNYDVGLGIAVNTLANAFVTGYTYSPNFPTTTGAFQTTFGGTSDAFVTKLNPTGSSPLVYSTYLGGYDVDWGLGIAVDALDNAYLTGYTESSNFPITSGALQPTRGGVVDAFVTKLNPTGSSPLVYSTYLGGVNYDEGFGIAVDPLDNAYVTGYTYSPNFPTTTGAFQPTFGGYLDAFVTKITDVVLPPPPSVGKVTGGGTINVSGGIGNLGFIVQTQSTTGPIGGQLQYVNHASGAKVRSEMFTTFVISGNMASFSGTCTQNGAPCMFKVDVEDNGEPGKNDSFKISINAGPQEGGTLRSGDIQIHK
jgi:hypothetical protein